MRRRRETTMEERFLTTGAVQPEAERRERPFVAMIAKGLLRLASYLGVAAAITAAIGLFVGWTRGGDYAQSLVYAYYLGGVAILVFGLLGGGHQIRDDEFIRDYEDRGQLSRGALMLVIGFFLIAVGVLIESQT
jgi:hypothetical protein